MLNHNAPNRFALRMDRQIWKLITTSRLPKVYTICDRPNNVCLIRFHAF